MFSVGTNLSNLCIYTRINIVACTSGKAINNLKALDLTLGLFDIRQTELRLIITLSTVRNYKNDNALKVSVSALR
jgi:hypothetical protein